MPSSNYHIPITGQLIDPLGDAVSGASVFFIAKATSRGSENVAKTTRAYFTTDSQGYYGTEVPSGWYTIEYQRPGDLDSVKLGAATVTGTDALDLGTLLANSIPPPSLLQDVSDVVATGLTNGAYLSWSVSRRKWVTTIGGNGSSGISSAELAATGAALMARDVAISGVLSSQIAASSAGVTSVNGISGLVTLRGTGTVTVTAAGQVITISGASGAAAGDVTSSQLTSTGVLLGNQISSLSGYSNATFATKVQATNTGVLLGARIDAVTTNLATTGTDLLGRINSLSGYSDATFATKVQLTATGVSLGARVDTVATNLATSGTTLHNRIGSLSGYSIATFATISNLAQTGSDLFNRDLSISGALVSRISAAAQGVSTLNALSGVLNILGTGTVTVTTNGQNIIVSGASGASVGGGAGDVTQAQLNAVSGFFLHSPQTNLAGGTALTVNGRYFDTFAANRALTFAGTPSGGTAIVLRGNMTASNVYLSFPSSYRLGFPNTTTGLNFNTGSNEISWIYADSKWWLADSSPDGIASLSSSISGGVSIIGAGVVTVTSAGNVITVSGSSGAGGSVGQAQLSPGFAYATGGVVNLTVDSTKATQNLGITATGNVILAIAGSYNGCAGTISINKTFAGTGSMVLPNGATIINLPGSTVMPLSTGNGVFDVASFIYDSHRSYWAISTLSGSSLNITNIYSGGGGGGTGEVTSDQLTQTGITLGAQIASLSGYSNDLFATKVQLTTTGQTLGTLISSVATNTQNNATNISGYVAATFATKADVTSTGVSLGNRIDSLSGYVNAGAKSVVFNVKTAAVYLATTADAFNTIAMSGTLSQRLVLPSGNAFTPGTQILIERHGTGTVHIGTTGTVIMQSRSGVSGLATQFSLATAILRNNTTWLVAGDMS